MRTCRPCTGREEEGMAGSLATSLSCHRARGRVGTGAAEGPTPEWGPWAHPQPRRTVPLCAGSQHGRSHPRQGHAETWRARRARSQGVLCLSIYPETKICLFTVCYTILFWHYHLFSGKSLFRAPVNSLLPIKRMFQFKLLWWLSNLPDRFPQNFTICELLTALQPREAQSLKHLKDTEPFLKS